MAILQFRPGDDGAFIASNQYGDDVATVHVPTRKVVRLRQLTLGQERRIDALVTAEILRAKLQALDNTAKETAARIPAPARTLAVKDCLTVAEVAHLMGFCKQTVIDLFVKEPGTIILNRPEKLHKRKYRSIRIPRGVYERVVRRMSV